MKQIIAIVLCVFASQVYSQTEATFSFALIDSKVEFKLEIPVEHIALIQANEKYCSESISLPFCVQNYLRDKLSIKQQEEMIDFRIKSSFSDKKVLKMTFNSIDYVQSIKELVISTTAFSEIEGWKNKFISGNMKTTILDKHNTVATLAF